MTSSLIPPVLSSHVPPRRCGLALASLVLGILGVVLCVMGPLLGIPAVTCGHMALSRISKSGGTLGGNGLAVAGLITGYVSIAMIVFLIPLAAIAIPNFVRARQASQHTACMINVQTINDVKRRWALQHHKSAQDVPTDEDLFGFEKYLREKPVCPANGTYILNPVGQRAACSIHGSR